VRASVRTTAMKILLAAVAVIATAAAAEAPMKLNKESPGKPSAAVTIQTDLSGALRGGVEQQVTITAVAEGSCDRLVTQITGVDGVTIRGGDAKDQGKVESGDRRTHSVFAQVPAGVRGQLVVRVSCERNGRHRDRVESFAVEAKGVNGEPAREKTEQVGELRQDASGQPVRVMRSHKP
jgi:hypothetical protein